MGGASLPVGLLGSTGAPTPPESSISSVGVLVAGMVLGAVGDGGGVRLFTRSAAVDRANSSDHAAWP